MSRVPWQEINGFRIRRSCLLDNSFTITITIILKLLLPDDATWLVHRLSCFIFWFLAELISSALSSALFATDLVSTLVFSDLLQSDGLEDTFLKGIRCSRNCSSFGFHSRGNVCQRMCCRVYNCRLGNDVFTVPCCMGNVTTEPLSSNGLLFCAFPTAHFRLSDSVYRVLLSNGLFELVVRPRVLTSHWLGTNARSDILTFRWHATILSQLSSWGTKERHKNHQQGQSRVLANHD
jgi:hypothetical protein